jgi:anthranilate phosphoribosyltransferase
LNQGSLEHLRGGEVADNAQIIREVLSGRRRDEARSLVIMTAAAALLLGGKAEKLHDAAVLAADAIDSGAAKIKLELLIKASNG